MRTTKLAVSVYALTLVLGINNALGAAVGTANPSCGANSFTINYNNNLGAACTGVGGYATSTNTGNFASPVVKWADTFTTLSAVTENYGTCLGCKLTGWGGDELTNPPLQTDTTYTNNSEVWNTYPAANGSTKFTLKAIWAPTSNTITLEQTNADTNSNPTTLERYGVKLRVGGNEISKLTTIPVNYGYNFQGYYSSSTRANQVAAELVKTTSTDSYLPTGTTCSNSDQAQWTNATVYNNCAWIGSDGTVGKFAGTAAAKVGGDLSLHPAWEPRKIQWKYEIPNSSSAGYAAKAPSPGDILWPVGNAGPFNGRYEDDKLSYATEPYDSTGLFLFDGWDVKITYGSNKTITKDEPIPIRGDTDADPRTQIGDIITKADWKTIGDNVIPMITFTARWEPNQVLMEYYPYYGATEPFAYYTVAAGVLTGRDDENHAYVGIYKANEDGETIKTTVDGELVSVGADLAADIEGISNGDTTLRGFVAMTGEGQEGRLATVAQTSGGFQYAGVTDMKQPYLVSMRDDNAADKWYFTPDYLDRNASSGEGDSEETDFLEMLQKIKNATNQNVVKVYGVWAENCTLDTGDATCTMYLQPSGAVTYVNTCASGYNIDNQDGVGEVPTTDDSNEQPFVADEQSQN